VLGLKSNQPFQIINNPAFHELMKTQRPDYYIPSTETLSHDIKNVFLQVQEHVSMMLKVISIWSNGQILTFTHQEYNGKLSFATDTWTSQNHKAYIAITVHLEQEGLLFSMLLDLSEVAKLHTGANLASGFADALEKFRIEKKVRFLSLKQIKLDTHNQILGVTADNTSNNDVMISKLGKIMTKIPGTANQTHCFSHTLSILAKVILKQFEIPKKKEGEVLDKAAQALSNLAGNLDLEECEEREMWETSDSDEEDQELDTWVDVCEGLMEEEVMALKESVQPVRSAWVKVQLPQVALQVFTLTLTHS
jgi:hypothetical protein